MRPLNSFLFLPACSKAAAENPCAKHCGKFGGPLLGAIRVEDFKFQFYQQPNGWPGEKVTTDMPTVVNIRQDPFGGVKGV